MKLSPSKINTFLLFKLPSAYFTGVRVKSISETTCITSVKHKWINQNPFKSIFWAVQGMAAELSTGALVMAKIRESNKNISMLVANNRATFSKKARGRIEFTCIEGALINQAIEKTIATGEGQTIWMKSEGKDTAGDKVSTFEFEWTLKLK
ncbi:MAG: thioesterase [Aequorivita sp.]|nr:thioesterase [Aequorivita sp.]|tara:strand:+ start:9205 stop:9657 length:453 start_codon:yes stop_codon:yes gene_type:complete